MRPTSIDPPDVEYCETFHEMDISSGFYTNCVFIECAIRIQEHFFKGCWFVDCNLEEAPGLVAQLNNNTLIINKYTTGEGNEPTTGNGSNV